MKERIRVAVLGNSFSTKVQLPALRWSGGNEVIGIAGADADKARATADAWGVPHATGDWRELLEHAPDLVVVSTPVHLHREMTLAALDAGCAVLCEKPFALDADEAAEMTARAAGRAAWLDHQLRWSPHVRAMRARIDEGFLGEPWHARIEMLFPSDAYVTRPHTWWFDAARGGGILGAIGSHMLDLARFLWGNILAVRCELRAFVSERPDASGAPQAVTADDFASFTVRFASGAIGEFVTAFAIPDDHAVRVQLTGREGTLRLTDGDSLTASRRGEAFEDIHVEPLLTSVEYGMEHDFGIFSRCQPLYMRDVVETVRRGETVLPDAATFEDGLHIQRVLDAARASASSGAGWIELA